MYSEYEKILDRVRQTKASVIRMSHRHFTAPVEEIDGTVDSVSPAGLTLKEFPGRKFQFSSVGTSAADMTARILGKHNKLTRSDAAREVERRRGELRQYLADNLSGGHSQGRFRERGEHPGRGHGRWQDIDFDSLTISVTKSIYRNVVGKTKTTASQKPVPLHPLIAIELKRWKAKSKYRTSKDYVFPSIRKNGTQPPPQIRSSRSTFVPCWSRWA